MNTAVEIARHLDDNPRSWPPSVEVRCAKGCTCIKAWAMTSGELVVLVNTATRRISAQWAESGAALEDSPFVAAVASADLDAGQVAHVWAERPTTALVFSCRHAQKVPLHLSGAQVWDGAHNDATHVISVAIPEVPPRTM